MNLSVAHGLQDNVARSLVERSAAEIMPAAALKRDMHHGRLISFSRKAFIPLTKLCRDVCLYCTFAKPPKRGERSFLTLEEVRGIAENAVAAACKEALFTLGDKPELRYRAAREELEALGFASTVDYLAAAAQVALDAGLFPHLNPGVLTADEIARLRRLSISQGLMLETTSERLTRRGGAHFGSPDKLPAVRLQMLEDSGRLSVPFTTGLLVGIGETRSERIDALLAIRDSHARHGHIQEVIIQNFLPKPDTRMADWPAAPPEEHLWTIAAARLILPSTMNIQAPPNLTPGGLGQLLAAGINDWGGVSPVTPDHVNPEAPWPHLDHLAAETRNAGHELVERLAVYPAATRDLQRWIDPALHSRLLAALDGAGYARCEEWAPGRAIDPPTIDLELMSSPPAPAKSRELIALLGRLQQGEPATESEIIDLFSARGSDFSAICRAADEIRRELNGDTVSYVVTRNINYTNICGYKCQFCAFSKGKMSESLRGRPYDLSLDEIAGRAREAAERGATEVCMQGGIHPHYTGQTYLDICRAVKAAVPEIHVHAFSPLEVQHGATTLGMSVPDFLAELRTAGLASLPGTAAEILDDEVRRILCADKVDTGTWLAVMRAAHKTGLRSTATIMFGHVDGYHNWARHLIRIRDLQQETGGFTEFVPLPFVHMEAPIFLKGRSRKGPTFRETVLMHAVARLAFGRLIPNIQASWVKLGRKGAAACLAAGVNDLGGTLMDETISRSAGASHGSEVTPVEMEDIIRAASRTPRQRTTLYGNPPTPSWPR